MISSSAGRFTDTIFSLVAKLFEGPVRFKLSLGVGFVPQKVFDDYMKASTQTGI
jgi:hypothetical protein